MLIKHNFFFLSILGFFWKVLRLKSFHKNPKIFNSAFWRLTFVSHASRKAPVASLHRRFRDSLVSETSSREKYLKKFQKFLVFIIFATTSRVEV